MSIFHCLDLQKFLLALIAGYAAWFLTRWLFSTSNERRPPSPPKLPIIGNLHQVDSRVLHRSLAGLSQQYGPLMFLKVGQRKVYVVSSAVLAKEMTKNYDIPISNRPATLANQRLFYNLKGLISLPYGDQWRKVRNIFVNHLLHKKRNKYFNSIRDEETAAIVENIGKLSSSSTPVNLSQLFGLLASGTICKTAFGKKRGGEQADKIVETIDDCVQLLFKVTIAEYVPSLAWINRLNGFDAAVDRICKVKDEMLEELMEENEGDQNKELGQVNRRGDYFIDVLVDMYKGSNQDVSIDRDTIKAAVQDVVGAGTDTSSLTLVWAMTELMRNPGAMKKLQDEVRGIMEGKQCITDDDIEKMTYVKAVIKETLRLHPAVPITSRQPTEDLKLMGYDILTGAIIWFNVWAIHRDPACWDDPEKFMPERFLNSIHEDFQYIPFGFGRRICPGMAFAFATMDRVLANLIHKFDWQLPDGMKIKDLDASEVFGGVTLKRKEPLVLVATKQKI